ncbi:YEH2 Sterol esterase 2 [Candida maltosa Xu316]
MSDSTPQSQPEQEHEIKQEPIIPPRDYHFHNTFVNHLTDKMLGREKYIQPDLEQRSHGYKPREAYDNLESMKPSCDLQYYLQALGLDLQEYEVTTVDGFILTMHRIIDPKETDEQRQHRKPCFLQHGLLSCSGTWIVSGKNSLGYYFHEQGFDVWLGNNRSWFVPKHSTLTGNLFNNEKYWAWSVQELGYYDLPAMIEAVLANKKYHKKLLLLGHSQGGLQSFLMLKNPHFKTLHEKIELFCPLGPAIYPGSLFYTRDFIRMINHRSKFVWLMLFGCCGFLRNLCLVRHYIANTALYGKISYCMFKYLFGWNGANWGANKKIWHFLFIFNMSYASVELMQYYLARFSPSGFTTLLQPKQAYKNDDHYLKNVVDDTKSYFQFDKSWFNDVLVPMVVFVGDNDHLVDGKRIIAHMKKHEPGYTEGRNFDFVEIPTYNHLDIVWAEDVIGSVGYVIMDKLNKLSKEEVKDEVTETVPTVAQPQGNTRDTEDADDDEAEEEVLDEKNPASPKNPEFILKDKPSPITPLNALPVPVTAS